MKRISETFYSLVEALDRYEVYDDGDRLMSVFDDESEAINFAMEHDASYVDLSGANTADFERIWTNDGEDYAQCWSCEDWFEKSELLNTDTGYLCPRCFDGLRSHGEPITVRYGYDDDISEYFDEELTEEKKKKQHAMGWFTSFMPDKEKGIDILNHNLGNDTSGNSGSEASSTGTSDAGGAD